MPVPGSATIRTDYAETVWLFGEADGDITLSLTRLIPRGCADETMQERTDEVRLRPSQAERLAAELLAYANGDHKLPPGAIRPRRVVEATPTPSHASDCAVHNEPAFPAGPCNCGVTL